MKANQHNSLNAYHAPVETGKRIQANTFTRSIYRRFAMIKKHDLKTPLLTALGLLAATSGAQAATLLDNNFDGVANDIGPAVQVLANAVGTKSADITTGFSETTGADNGSIGFNTSGTVDASAAPSFTIEWVVSDFNGDGTLDGKGSDSSYIDYNGWFFGVTTDTGSGGSSLWVNTGEAVGILLDGGASFTDWSFVQRTGGSLDANTGLNGSQPSFGTFDDGFTVSLTVNDDDTWSASSTGLSNNISSSGSLASGTYATIAGSLVANTTIQGTGVDYTVDSVTITAVPEPGSLALMGLGGLLIARRRRDK